MFFYFSPFFEMDFPKEMPLNEGMSQSMTKDQKKKCLIDIRSISILIRHIVSTSSYRPSWFVEMKCVA